MEKNKMRNAIPWITAFLGAWAVKWMIHAPGDRLGYTNSILSVFVFAALAFLLRKVWGHSFTGKGQRWILPGLFGGVFTVCMVFGVRLDLVGNVDLADGAMWIAILVLGVIDTFCLRYFWDLLCAGGSRAKQPSEVPDGKISVKRILILTCVIFLCYLPVFLAVYPGFFVYDAMEEVNQVVTRNFSTHHPLFHVLLLGGVVQAGYKLSGSYNVGIAIYTLCQMAVMAGIFAWSTEWLRKKGLSKAGQIVLCLYFGICPVLVMFSLCSAKDGLFTGMLFILLLLVKDLCEQPEKFWKSKGRVIFLVLSATGMMLLRHNGFYAFLVFIPVLTVFLRRYWKRTLLSALAAVALYGMISAGLTGVLHADHSENQEMLTVPIMQLARVYHYEKDALTQEELAQLYRYLPEESLERYTPKLSDMVKIGFGNEAFKQDKAGFIKLWLSLFAKHPSTYLNAWFMTSYGFWYPDTVIDVYRGNQVFTFQYGDSSYFGYEVEQPGTRESKLPWLDQLYRKMSLEIFQQKIPVVSMLFSPGFLLWVMLFMVGGLWYGKRYEKVIPYALLILCWLTVVIGPTYLVRYVVYLWVAVPVLIIDVCKMCKVAKNTDLLYDFTGDTQEGK